MLEYNYVWPLPSYNFLKVNTMLRMNYIPGLLREYCIRSSHSSMSSCSLQKAIACSMSLSSCVIKTNASFVFPIRPVNRSHSPVIFDIQSVSHIYVWHTVCPTYLYLTYSLPHISTFDIQSVSHIYIWHTVCLTYVHLTYSLSHICTFDIQSVSHIYIWHTVCLTYLHFTYSLSHISTLLLLP